MSLEKAEIKISILKDSEEKQKEILESKKNSLLENQGAGIVLRMIGDYIDNYLRESLSAKKCEELEYDIKTAEYIKTHILHIFEKVKNLVGQQKNNTFVYKGAISSAEQSLDSIRKMISEQEAVIESKKRIIKEMKEESKEKDNMHESDKIISMPVKKKRGRKPKNANK